MRSTSLLLTLMLVAGCGGASGEPAPFEDGLVLTYELITVMFEADSVDLDIVFEKSGDEFKVTTGIADEEEFSGESVLVRQNGMMKGGKHLTIHLWGLDFPLWIPKNLRQKGGVVYENQEREVKVAINKDVDWNGMEAVMADYAHKALIMTSNYKLRLTYEKSTGFLTDLFYATHLGDGFEIHLRDSNAKGLAAAFKE